jgi:hypothetical protein
MTREHWAQIGITTQFLIVVRTLGEIFRIRYVHGANFSAGAEVATLYFLRRYTLSVWIAIASVIILLAYKIILIGW